MDAFNEMECSIIERKCTCRPATIKKGIAQLQRYCDSKKEETGQPHEGILEVLDPTTGVITRNVAIPKAGGG